MSSISIILGRVQLRRGWKGVGAIVLTLRDGTIALTLRDGAIRTGQVVVAAAATLRDG